MKDSPSEGGVVEPSKDQKIWLVVLAIPPGKVASYGQVAAMAGLGRQARYAFAPGSETYQEQVSRLQEEGVAVVNGRVSMSRFGW